MEIFMGFIPKKSNIQGPAWQKITFFVIDKTGTAAMIKSE